MSKKGYRSTTLSLPLHEWLATYKKGKGLRSIAQAIEFLIREAGYTLESPPQKEPEKGD